MFLRSAVVNFTKIYQLNLESCMYKRASFKREKKKSINSKISGAEMIFDVTAQALHCILGHVSWLSSQSATSSRLVTGEM